MSIQGNPYVINDSSLIMYYDFGNIKSYPIRTATPSLGNPVNDLSQYKNNGIIFANVISNGFSTNNLGYMSYNSSLANIVRVYPTTPFLNTAAYTKCAWFRISNSVPKNGIWPNFSANIFGGGQYYNHYFGLWQWNGYSYLSAGNNTLAAGNVGILPLAAAVWHFGAAVWNSSTGWVFYLNDNRVPTHNNNTAGLSTVFSQVTIGTYGLISNNPPFDYTYTNYTYNFWGDIALVMAYNRGLNSEEVLQIYNTTKSRFV